MKRWLGIAATIACVGLLAPAFASATPGKHPKNGGHDRSAPEFDPSAAGVIAVLLAGGGVLLARRTRR